MQTILNAAVISFWIVQAVMFVRSYRRFLKAERIASIIREAK